MKKQKQVKKEKPKKTIIKQKKEKKSNILIIGIIILVILIIAAIFVTVAIKNPKKEDANIKDIKADINASPVILDTNEDVTFEEFKVRYTALMQKSQDLSLKIQPEFLSELNVLQKPVFEEITTTLNLNKAEQDACLKANDQTNKDFNAEKAEIMQKIFLDTQFGQMIGITGTPSVVVNGQPIGGYVSYADLKAAIETAIDGNQTTDQLYNEADSYFGNKDSKVVLYIFSDYYCSYCKNLAEESLTKLKTEYIETNKIKFVPKDFIRYEPSAAIYARCAEKQGKYFEAELELFSKYTEFSNNLQTAQTTITEKYSEELNAFESELAILKKWSEEHPEEFEEFQKTLISETE